MQNFREHIKNKCHTGFSLVEMLVVIAIFTLLSIAITVSIQKFYQFNAYTIAQSYQVQNARRGLEFTVRDLREMTYADNGAFPLISVGTTSVSFYSDIDRDESVELVAYELIDTTLYKYIYNAVADSYDTTSPDQTIIISEYVQNRLQDINIFDYVDYNGVVATGATNISDIRYINVNLIINIDPVRDPGEYSLRSGAALRNLIENL